MVAEAHKTLEIELDGSRWKHLFWAAVGIGVAVVLVINMGLIGWVLGGLVGVSGVRSLWEFVKTLLHEPGSIIIRDDGITVPEKISSGLLMTVPPDELRHAYLLRSALPWFKTGPVLVIETKRKVFELPRDWFSDESDQRSIVSALNRRLGRIP